MYDGHIDKSAGRQTNRVLPTPHRQQFRRLAFFFVATLFLLATLYGAIAGGNRITQVGVLLEPKNASNATQDNTVFAYNFVFANTTSCVADLNISQTVTTDQNGRAFVVLNTTSLAHVPNYLCEYRNGTLETVHLQNPNLYENQSDGTGTDDQTLSWNDTINVLSIESGNSVNLSNYGQGLTVNGTTNLFTPSATQLIVSPSNVYMESNNGGSFGLFDTYIQIYSNETIDIQSETGAYGFYGGSSPNGILNFTAITARRNYVFPDASGTLALTSDITTVESRIDDLNSSVIANSSAQLVLIERNADGIASLPNLSVSDVAGIAPNATAGYGIVINGQQVNVSADTCDPDTEQSVWNGTGFECATDAGVGGGMTSFVLSNKSVTEDITDGERVNISGGRNTTVEQVGAELIIHAIDTDTDTQQNYQWRLLNEVIGNNTQVVNGTGILFDGKSINHSDTSTQASIDSSGRTYVQDVTLDGFGHVTGLTTATETVVDTNRSDAEIETVSAAGVQNASIARKGDVLNTTTLFANATGDINVTGTFNALVLEANCVAITGSADLCDGSDDGAGGSYDLNVSNGTASITITDGETFSLLGGDNLSVNCTGNSCTFNAAIQGGGGGTPGGSDTQVQFNDGGSFGGDANFTFNKSLQQLIIPSGSSSVPSLRFVADADSGLRGLTDRMYWVNGGSAYWGFDTVKLFSNFGGAALLTAVPTATTPSVVPNYNDIDTGLGLSGGDKLTVIAGGNTVLTVSDDVGDEALLVKPVASTDIGLTIQGAASQSANLQEWQNSTGGVLSFVDSAGNLTLSGLAGSGTAYACLDANGKLYRSASACV